MGEGGVRTIRKRKVGDIILAEPLRTALFVVLLPSARSRKPWLWEALQYLTKGKAIRFTQIHAGRAIKLSLARRVHCRRLCNAMIRRLKEQSNNKQ